jgi:hypothetical protein
MQVCVRPMHVVCVPGLGSISPAPVPLFIKSSGGLRTYHGELAVYKEFVNFPIVPAAFVSVRSPDCEL